MSLAVLCAAACGPSENRPAADAADAGARAAPADAAALEQQLAALERRKVRIEDINAIERLQHAYGYYIDEGLWDEAADLFAPDGTIELGLDGVYTGRARVRAYLAALGNGRRGLAEGVLNEHLQIMPVITLAADGRSAQGRWRAVVLGGELGKGGYWAEGPYENTYVKEDGVWKIRSLHWFQTVAVPYEGGGWQTQPDMNGGIWVSDEFPPDAPPSVPYTTWPAPFVPPYHFANPVARYTGPGSSVAAGAPSPGPGQAAAAVPFADAVPPPAESAAAAHSPRELAAAITALELEVERLEAEHEIENLQRIFGYYSDKQLWSHAAALFAANGTLESGASGVYVGPARIREYLALAGPESPQPGRLYDRMQLQQIVTVDPSLQRARGRWHLFAQEAKSGEYARWGLGVYENEYVREGGVWKIAALHLYPTMYTPYEDGWGKTALPNPGPSRDVPPDRAASVAYEPYPETFVVPFHYEHPVNGTPAYGPLTSAANAPAGRGSAARSASGNSSASSAGAENGVAGGLNALEQRIARLEDVAAIERLHSIYGYYLADKSWDDLAGIFAPDGTIEIALRGVYVGQPSVRRNLDLYNEEGTDLLHNHMQFQPVIHVARDGQTAQMRSRAFSIMGKFNRYAQWMGGVYENDFAKVDGVWTIKKDHQINTYFAPYAAGWKDLQPRPPPQVNPNNPPDLPPSETFVMYPGAYLPAYHYPHPVTGETVTWQRPSGETP